MENPPPNKLNFICFFTKRRGVGRRKRKSRCKTFDKLVAWQVAKKFEYFLYAYIRLEGVWGLWAISIGTEDHKNVR